MLFTDLITVTTDFGKSAKMVNTFRVDGSAWVVEAFTRDGKARFVLNAASDCCMEVPAFINGLYCACQQNFIHRGERLVWLPTFYVGKEGVEKWDESNFSPTESALCQPLLPDAQGEQRLDELSLLYGDGSAYAGMIALSELRVGLVDYLFDPQRPWWNHNKTVTNR